MATFLFAEISISISCFFLNQLKLSIRVRKKYPFVYLQIKNKFFAFYEKYLLYLFFYISEL
jgi:hypothetical protein